MDYRINVLDIMTDEVFGKIGTPKRDAMECRLKRELEAYKNWQDAGGRQELTK